MYRPGSNKIDTKWKNATTLDLLFCKDTLNGNSGQ